MPTVRKHHDARTHGRTHLAHAASTRVGDKIEFDALDDVFQGRIPPLTANKSMIGHCMGAFSAIETIWALKSLEELGLRGKISIIGIAKRLEEIYFPQDPIPLYLDKKSETLRVIQQLRNEAHRFGITFHRNKRSKAAINSVLQGIEGIGEKTAQELLRKFKSVKRIRESSLEDLTSVIGPAKARKVYDSLRE